MKTALVITLATLLPSLAAAQGYETIEQSRQRHSAQNYDTYRNNGNQAPLGGYQERLGDPSPAGTLRPGYVETYRQPNNYGSGTLDERMDRRK